MSSRGKGHQPVSGNGNSSHYTPTPAPQIPQNNYNFYNTPIYGNQMINSINSIRNPIMQRHRPVNDMYMYSTQQPGTYAIANGYSVPLTSMYTQPSAPYMASPFSCSTEDTYSLPYIRSDGRHMQDRISNSSQMFVSNEPHVPEPRYPNRIPIINPDTLQEVNVNDEVSPSSVETLEPPPNVIEETNNNNESNSITTTTTPVQQIPAEKTISETEQLDNIIHTETQEKITEKIDENASLSEQVQSLEIAKTKKNKNKIKKAELNRKGEEKTTGSDMDVFKDLNHHEKNNIVDEKEISEIPLNSFVTEKEVVTREIVPASVIINEEEEKSAVDGAEVSKEVDKIGDVIVEETKEIDSEESTTKESFKLKYEYKEDQWSPLNVEGKKQYDRDFLILLQNDPMSLTKPENLPDMEIIKNEAINSAKSLRNKNQNSDFMPGFMASSSLIKSGSRGNTGSNLVKRHSRDGRGNRTMPQNRPITITGLSFQEKVELHTSENAWKPTLKKENCETTNSSMDELLKKVRSILNKLTPQNFDTLIVKFNSLTIDTQDKLKQCMQLVYNKAVDEPEFSTAYANMCDVMQKKHVVSEDDQQILFKKLLIQRCQEEFQKDYMAEVETKDLKYDEMTKEERELHEYNERKARRKSLGNIRFIGELFKLRMLTRKIMHECFNQLLRWNNEESLECLCRLLTTVGKVFEIDDNNMGIDDLSKYFDKMATIVDDKKMSSRIRFMLQDVIDLRRDNWKPRREAAGPKKIHEIHKEVEREKTHQQLSSYGRIESGNRTGSRGSHSYDKRSSSSRNFPQQNISDDGWYVATKTNIRTYERIDMHKFKNMGNSNHVDADNLQLGPGHASTVNWGKGSMSGSRTSQTKTDEPLTQKNRFGSLSASTTDNVSNDHRRTASMDHSKRSITKSNCTMTKLKGDKNLSPTEVTKISKSLMNQLYSDGDYSEITTSILEKIHADTMEYFVNFCLCYSLEKKTEERKLTGFILSHLITDVKVLTIKLLEKALDELMKNADDIKTDIPKFWDYVAELLISMLASQGGISFSYVIQLTKKSEFLTKNESLKLLSTVLSGLEKTKGQTFVQELWNKNTEAFHEIIPSTELSEFLKEHQLEYLDDVPFKLRQLLQEVENNDEIFKWIDTTLGPKTHDLKFIRLLVDECFRSAIENNTLSKHLSYRFVLMKRYIENVRERELETLYAVQNLVHRMDHPSLLLHEIFERLYNEELVTDEVLEDWYSSENPAEMEGKGVARTSLSRFFTWLRENN